MIHSYMFSEGNGIRCGLSREEISQALKGKDEGALLWVDLEAPTDDEMKILSEVFGFHPLAVEDCLHYTEFPKVDEYPEYIFIVVHGVNLDPAMNEVIIPEFDLFVGKNYVVTVHTLPVQSVVDVRKRYDESPQLLKKGVDRLIHAIVDSLVDSFFPVIDRFGEAIEDIEERLVSGQLDDILDVMLKIRKNVLKLRRTINPQREVIRRLAYEDIDVISETTRVYFKDVYDHILRIYELVENERELLGMAFQVYFSAVSNNMNETSNRLNIVMQRLTAITTIFLPLSFIAGVYGMNFEHMPELRWRYGYFIIWGVMLFLGLGLYRYFKKRGWI